jgi:hypothetical protein
MSVIDQFAHAMMVSRCFHLLETHTDSRARLPGPVFISTSSRM